MIRSYRLLWTNKNERCCPTAHVESIVPAAVPATALPHTALLYCRFTKRDRVRCCHTTASVTRGLSTNSVNQPNVLAFLALADWACFGIPVCCDISLPCYQLTGGTELYFFSRGHFYVLKTGSLVGIQMTHLCGNVMTHSHGWWPFLNFA